MHKRWRICLNLFKQYISKTFREPNIPNRSPIFKMHLWKYAWDKPALILIILWEPKKEVGRSLSANNAKNLNIVKHLWQRMIHEQLLSIYHLSWEDGSRSWPLDPVASSCVNQWKNIVYTLVPVSIPTVPVVSPLYVRLKTAMRQIQHRASTDSCKLDGNIAWGGEVEKLWGEPLWTSKSELRKRHREPASGFPTLCSGSCLKAPVWLAPNMLANAKTKLIPCGAAENVQPKSWDDDR